jgi:hypothetical protein
MARERAEARRQAAVGAADPAGRTEELTSRLVGGMNRLAGQFNRSAKRVKDAAQDLRTSVVLQHAVAARERSNLEAAFWLFREEFSQHPDDIGVALPYWDVALSFERGDIASPAGVMLVETRAAAGETELAAQHWIELIQQAPEELVSPIAIATILPALKARLANANEDGPEDRNTLAGYLRRAVRHAVDPRNTELHPGVALRIFEEGREINPEASRRIAEAILESPHLHEAKRERLTEWLAGNHAEAPIAEPNPPPKSAEPEPKAAPKPAEPEPKAAQKPAESEPTAAPKPAEPELKAAPKPAEPELKAAQKPAEPETKAAPKPAEPEPKAAPKPAEPEPSATKKRENGLSKEQIAAASARLPQAEPAPRVPVEEEAPSGPSVECGTLTGIEDDALVVQGATNGRLRYGDIQAVAVAEIMGLEDQAVTVIDLILNWTRRNDEPLEIVRLRMNDLDLESLVTSTDALGSDFAALMGEILERTSAVPLPDPESALGTRIACYESQERYERIGLRVQDRAA